MRRPPVEKITAPLPPSPLPPSPLPPPLMTPPVEDETSPPVLEESGCSSTGA
jgi:hypothetical protein